MNYSLEHCLTHSNNHSTELSDDVFVLVHHNYPSHIQGSENLLKREDLPAYNSALKEVINTANNTDWTIALFTSSELYEDVKKPLKSGAFNKAFFTKHRSGALINKRELNEFIGRRLVVAGWFSEMCVNTAVRCLMKKCSEVSVLCEGLLFYYHALEGIPKSNDYLLKRNMNEGIMPKVKITHLEEITPLPCQECSQALLNTAY